MSAYLISVCRSDAAALAPLDRSCDVLPVGDVAAILLETTHNSPNSRPDRKQIRDLSQAIFRICPSLPASLVMPTSTRALEAALNSQEAELSEAILNVQGYVEFVFRVEPIRKLGSIPYVGEALAPTDVNVDMSNQRPPSYLRRQAAALRKESSQMGRSALEQLTIRLSHAYAASVRLTSYSRSAEGETFSVLMPMICAKAIKSEIETACRATIHASDQGDAHMSAFGPMPPFLYAAPFLNTLGRANDPKSAKGSAKGAAHAA